MLYYAFQVLDFFLGCCVGVLVGAAWYEVWRRVEPFPLKR